MVLLGDGVVTRAGSVNELQKSGSLEKILAEDRKEDKEEEDTTLKPEDDGEEHNSLKKITSRANEPKIDEGGIDTKGESKGKKFIEDEKREV